MKPAVQRPTASPSDAELLERVAAAESDALGALFDRYAAGVFGFARRLTSQDEAEDIVQETFLRIGRVAASYDARSATARPWIFGVAFAIVRERRRSVARLVRALRGMASHNEKRSMQPVGSARAELERCLDSLSHDKREVLILTEILGMSGPEAAEVLGVPVSTVWMRLHHARKELRQRTGGTHE